MKNWTRRGVLGLLAAAGLGWRQREEKKPMTGRSQSEPPDLGAVFDAHVRHEFVDQDVEATMETMVAEPSVYHLPTMTGGNGYSGVYSFYRDHFIGKWPADTTVTPISRTVGHDQVVDEFVLSFTHDRAIDVLLPGVPPTGQRVELPHVVVMKFQGDKIAHEHIYWDQASLLVQAGLLDPADVCRTQRDAPVGRGRTGSCRGGRVDAVTRDQGSLLSHGPVVSWHARCGWR